MYEYILVKLVKQEVNELKLAREEWDLYLNLK